MDLARARRRLVALDALIGDQAAAVGERRNARLARAHLLAEHPELEGPEPSPVAPPQPPEPPPRRRPPTRKAAPRSRPAPAPPPPPEFDLVDELVARGRAALDELIADLWPQP